jgi:WD40 repeat protein
MGWPLSQEYNEAIQSPDSSFGDDELRQGEAVTNALGIPMPRSGNFADVYEVKCPNGSRWAVKCFTREVRGLRERYQEISRHLQQAKLPFTVEFTYLEEGIHIRGSWYPILKMQWVEGLTYNEFVRQHLDKPAMLGALLQIWGRMATRLRDAGIAHADLQHGNVLLVPGSAANSVAVKLIDYDGMYVPSLAGKKSGEVGHPSYQHPQRLREGTYGAEVDRFPLLLIATSLRCLEGSGRALWQRYDNGDNLLFREADLRAPEKSALWRELDGLSDPGARLLVGRLRKALDGRLDEAPLLDEVLAELKPVMATAIQAARPTPTTARSAASPPPATATTVRARLEPEAAPLRVTAVAVEDDEEEEEVHEETERRPRRRKKRLKKQSRAVLWAGAAAALVLLVGGLIAWALLGRGPARADLDKDADNRQARVDARDRGAKDAPVKEGPPQKADPPRDGAGERPDRPVAKHGNVRTVQVVQSSPLNHKQRITSLTVSQDGKRAVVTSVEGSLSYWELKGTFKGTGPNNPPRLGKAWVASVSADGNRVLAAESTGGLGLWDLATRKEEVHLATPDNLPANHVALSPDESHCAAATNRGMSVWDLKTQKEIPLETKKRINDLRFLPDGKQLLSADSDGKGVLWNVLTGEVIHRLDFSTRGLECLAISADGKFAAASGRDMHVHVWDLTTAREAYMSEAMPVVPFHIAISPEGLLVAAGANLGRHHLWFWDLASGKELGRFEGDSYAAMSMAFADERTLITAAPLEGFPIRVLRITLDGQPDAPPRDGPGERPDKPSAQNELTLRELHSANEHKGTISRILSTHEGRIVTSAWDGAVKVWTLDDKLKLAQSYSVNADGGGLLGMALSADEKFVLAGGGATVLTVDLKTGRVPWRSGKQADLVRCFDCSADGQLGVSGAGNVASVWDLKTNREIKRFTGHTSLVHAVCFLPDSKRVLSASPADKSLRLWEARTGKELLRFDGHTKGVEAMALAPDGKRAVSGGWDNTVRGWDVSTGREVYCLEGFPKFVQAVAISPDGRIGVGAGGNELRIWDMKTGRILAKHNGEEFWFDKVAFSANGKFLLCTPANSNTVLKVYELSAKAP